MLAKGAEKKDPRSEEGEGAEAEVGVEEAEPKLKKRKRTHQTGEEEITSKRIISLNNQLRIKIKLLTINRIIKQILNANH